MNSGPLLFLGLLFTMACSWLTFVMGPQLQVGRMQPATNLVSQELYPNPYEGVSGQGSQVYRANGCVSCHSQQIRAKSFGPDMAHYLAIRPSTAYDYLYDQPVLLGDQRIGPDLAAVGLHFDRAGLLQKLYEPRLSAPGSVMPSYRYLFETRKITFAPSTNALALPPQLAAPAGYEVVPTPAAEELAGYLLSRRQNVFIYFAPPPPTNAPATNAPVKK
ncbi:MAG TPA: cbb3-type cytochrome c oxidase subunit II [Verrucomicrobiae bacterium]|jgi:cytochrome c oxidase cbb3-type subunit 2|nr:cbb3-type cytochrome c oxidase subunit II [Verrucomicrobiae bacterium]